jgi:integrase
MGLRDYTMFLLMTHYGLRPSEIVDLTLDDIAWRKGEIRVVQRKTGQPLYLPLMDQVASAKQSEGKSRSKSSTLEKSD